jgi:hypothetical protein
MRPASELFSLGQNGASKSLTGWQTLKSTRAMHFGQMKAVFQLCIRNIHADSGPFLLENAHGYCVEQIEIMPIRTFAVWRHSRASHARRQCTVQVRERAAQGAPTCESPSATDSGAVLTPL